LPVICEQLIAHGRAASTPAALVQQGTTRNQRVFAATLADLPGRVATEQVQAPTLLIVGEVVQLREKLAWFEGAAQTE
ncbi:MAG: siroheme synthase, partial [Pigmentiphaga sp.]